MTKNLKNEKNEKMKKMKKNQKHEKSYQKEIITKSVQKNAGATFVRIRNSHEANVTFLQKRSCDQEQDTP